jgi:hypothetical protein
LAVILDRRCHRGSTREGKAMTETTKKKKRWQYYAILRPGYEPMVASRKRDLNRWSDGDEKHFYKVRIVKVAHVRP